MKKKFIFYIILFITIYDAKASEKNIQQPIDYDTLQKAQKTLTNRFHKEVSLASSADIRIVKTKKYYNKLQELNQQYTAFLALVQENDDDAELH